MCTYVPGKRQKRRVRYGKDGASLTKGSDASVRRDKSHGGKADQGRPASTKATLASPDKLLRRSSTNKSHGNQGKRVLFVPQANGSSPVMSGEGWKELGRGDSCSIPRGTSAPSKWMFFWLSAHFANPPETESPSAP